MVKIRLVGSLVSYAQTDEIELDVPLPTTIVELIAHVARDERGQKLTKMILDHELNDPRPNAIIPINQKEIGVLEGLESKVSGDDIVTLVLVTHGG